jgi:hypothetical protein
VSIYSQFIPKKFGWIVLLCFEAVLVRDCEAIDSADLGTSSKESY